MVSIRETVIGCGLTPSPISLAAATRSAVEVVNFLALDEDDEEEEDEEEDEEVWLLRIAPSTRLFLCSSKTLSRIGKARFKGTNSCSSSGLWKGNWSVLVSKLGRDRPLESYTNRGTSMPGEGEGVT